MSDDMYDRLRRAVIEILGPRPAAERRQQIASDLRALAEQQERMAERDLRPAANDSPNAAGTGRTPGFYIRINHDIDRQTGGRRVRLSLGRQIWYELGSPERIVVQPVGGNIWIAEDKSGSGMKLNTDIGLPSCIIADSSPLAGFAPGRYVASLLAGAIMVGERLA